MFLLFFAGVMIVGLVVFVRSDSEPSGRRPFTNEAEYFSRLHNTEQLAEHFSRLRQIEQLDVQSFL